MLMQSKKRAANLFKKFQAVEICRNLRHGEWILVPVNECTVLYSAVDLIMNLCLNIVKLFRLSQLHMQFVFSC